jgi:hypothetical protein
LLVPNKQVAKAGVPISFVVRAVDPSDLPLRVEGTRIPPGASFNPLTGVFEWSPEVSQAGRHRITFTATNSARQSATSQVEIEVDSGTPALNQPTSPCSPAAVVTLTGKWLGVPGSQFSDPTGASLNLGGTTVVVNGQAVPVLYSSADRVDFLCPALEVAAGTQLTVVTISMVEATPRILSPRDSNQDQGLISFETMNDLVIGRNFRVPAHPAQPGDEIVIFATGLG